MLRGEILKYDIISEDYLIAKSLENCCKKGKINISNDIQQILEKNFYGEFSFIQNEEYNYYLKRKIEGFYLKENKNNF